jgi:hypothetical protein
MKIIPLTWNHAWWIPLTILYYVVFSYLSKLNNDHSDDVDIWWKSKYLWTMFVFGALCPLWIIVTRVSKNIMFDGMIYDNLMFLTYVFTMVALGAGSGLNSFQWCGVGLMVLGSIMMRITTL